MVTITFPDRDAEKPQKGEPQKGVANRWRSGQPMPNRTVDSEEEYVPCGG